MTEEKEWWELLLWDTMPKTWSMLPEKTKNEIRKKGIAPHYDTALKKEGDKI